MRDLSQYPFEIRPLSEEEGGGFLISFPDFSECISDGETPEEAIRNGLDALQETIAALESMNLPVPEPGSGGSFSGKFVQHFQSWGQIRPCQIGPTQHGRAIGFGRWARSAE